MAYGKSIVRSFAYAFEGVLHALKYNRNLRIDFLVALIVIFLGIYFQVSHFEIGLLVVMAIVVISSEMINTALEEMVNLITNEHKKEAKIAKDVAAGMVFVASIGSVVVGALIFLPYILRLL